MRGARIWNKFTLRGGPILTQVLVEAASHSGSGMNPVGQSPVSLSSGAAAAASFATEVSASTAVSSVFAVATAASATEK